MIRLATIEDQSALVRLCKKDAWDGTTILSAFQSKCADVYNADWQYCDIWMGTSDAQNKNAQYVLCRLGQTFLLSENHIPNNAGRNCTPFCPCRRQNPS